MKRETTYIISRKGGVFILLSKTIKTKWSPQTRKRYESLGYIFTQYGDEFEIKIEDASPNIGSDILVQCDYCNVIFDSNMIKYSKAHQSGDKDSCYKCATRKSRELDLQKRATNAFSKLYQIMKEMNYTLLTDISEYTNMKMKIRYLCHKHNLQTSTLGHLLEGHCCLECANEKRGENLRTPISLIDSYIQRHNNEWLNKDEYINSFQNNLLIKCQCGNNYITSWSKYRYKNIIRCSKCSQKQSIGELLIEEYLINNQIDYIKEKRFNNCKDIKPLPFDFYIEQYNLIIEFDGKQHFQPVFGIKSFNKTQKHDKMKNEYCKNNNIELLRIPYWEGHNIETLIQNKLDDISRRYSLVS